MVLSSTVCLPEEKVVAEQPVPMHWPLNRLPKRHVYPMKPVRCAWTSRETHPSDLRTCQLTSHAALLAPQGDLRPLIELLDGVLAIRQP